MSLELEQMCASVLMCENHVEQLSTSVEHSPTEVYACSMTKFHPKSM